MRSDLTEKTKALEARLRDIGAKEATHVEREKSISTAEADLAKREKLQTSSRKEWEDHQVAATRDTKRRETAAKSELEEARRLLAAVETKEKQLGLRETEFRAKEARSEEHTSELQSRFDLVCRL